MLGEEGEGEGEQLFTASNEEAERSKVASSEHGLV